MARKRAKTLAVKVGLEHSTFTTCVHTLHEYTWRGSAACDLFRYVTRVTDSHTSRVSLIHIRHTCVTCLIHIRHTCVACLIHACQYITHIHMAGKRAKMMDGNERLQHTPTQGTHSPPLCVHYKCMHYAHTHCYIWRGSAQRRGKWRWDSNTRHSLFVRTHYVYIYVYIYI